MQIISLSKFITTCNLNEKLQKKFNYLGSRFSDLWNTSAKLPDVLLFYIFKGCFWIWTLDGDLEAVLLTLSAAFSIFFITIAPSMKQFINIVLTQIDRKKHFFCRYVSIFKINTCQCGNLLLFLLDTEVTFLPLWNKVNKVSNANH